MSVSVAHSQDWPEVISGLLDFYRRLEVADAVVLALEISEHLDAVAVIRVHWRLQRVDGVGLYDFTAVYTLARLGDDLKIIAIAHDELAKIRAASLTILTG